MSRRRQRAGVHHRSRRIAAAALLAAAGVAACAGSLAASLRSRDPVAAHRLAPWDGRLTALAGRALLTADADASARREAAALSRRALRQDPTTVAAASTLGLVRSIDGDAADARRVMRYAERLSRRDLATQVWAIEDAVGRGDVAGALGHYDTALRTSGQAAGILFPVLATAIDNADVRASLVRRLADRPLWQGGFLDYAAVNAPDPRAVARLFAAIRPPALPPSAGAHAALLTRLVDNGAPDLAWRYYARLRPGADRARSRDPGFAVALAAPFPFDWVVGTDPGIVAVLRGGGEAFDFAAPPSVSGTLLYQLQALPAGRYRLTGHSRGVDEPDETAPFWSLSCRNGVELGRVAVTASARAGGGFNGTVTVPAGCPVQVLALIARPSSKVAGLSGQIVDVALQPADR